MKGLIFSGRIDKDGSIHLPKTMRLHMVAAFRGKRIIVKVEEEREKHTDAQRGYYRACCLPSLIIGFNQNGSQLDPSSKEDLSLMHDFCKWKFLKNKGREIFTPDGIAIHLPASTEDLSKPEYGQYLDDIAQWAAEYLHIVIPGPNEQIRIF